MKRVLSVILIIVLILSIATIMPAAVHAAKLLNTPKITQITSIDSGTHIIWNRVQGAKRYRIFIQTARGWKKLSDTKSNTYIDKSVKSGTVRTYTIRCIDNTGKRYASNFDRKGREYTYNMPTPKLKSITSTNGYIQIHWQSVKGAKRYRIFRKIGSSWKKVADTTGTSYSDKSAKPGNQYVYTVRCLSYDKKRYTSAYNKKGWTIICKSPSTNPQLSPPTQPSTQPSTQPPTQSPKQPSIQPPTQPSSQPSTQPSSQAANIIPKIDSLTCINDSVIIRWTPIEKVQSYYLYYREDGKDWKYYTIVKDGEYDFDNSSRLKEGQPISFSLQYDKFTNGKAERISDPIGKTIVFHSTGILPDLTTARPQWFKPARYQTVDNIRFDMSYAGEKSYTIGKDEVTTFAGKPTYNDISYTLYADASIDPDKLIVKVNNGQAYDIDRYDNIHFRHLDTSSLSDDSPEPEVYRSRLKALKATKELPSFSCRVNGSKGYAVASICAEYSRIKHKDKLSRYNYDDYYPNNTLKLTIKVKTVFAQKANFPIDIYYRGKLVQHTEFSLDLVNGVSKMGAYDAKRSFLNNAEAACWKNNMTSKEKMTALARYLNKNYTYSEMICCDYAAYMTIAAQDLGLNSVLIVPTANVSSSANASSQDALRKVYLQEIGYPVIFNLYEGIPGIHCYCLAKLPDGAYYQFEGTGGKNGNGAYIAEKTNITDSDLYQKRGC